MSRRSNRNTITIDRRELERVIDAAIARRYTPPAGANVTPIPQDVINQMYSALAPQSKTQGMFTPGAPIRPVEDITPAQGPRQFAYKIGYNIGQLPRSTEMTSFATLRNLASLYDGIGMCEQVWFDLCSKPELVIQPRVRLTQDDNGDPIPPAKLHAIYGDRVQKWEDFFAKPDKRRSLKVWMRMALKEKLEIDALSTFKHKDRSGGLYALEILDGSTIKPLLDERGMAPAPPYPAYQQFVYGVPGMLILDTDLIYRREVERTDSPYGLSRVERIILRINQALRKQNKDLSFFTEGNIPAGFFSPSDDGTTDWTPEQLLMYQQIWDGLLAGNDSTRSRGRWVPPGTVYTKTDVDDIMTPFDMFLLNVTVGMFGLTMSELGFTETVNKSSGETQEAVIYRRAMAPMMDDFAEVFTDVMVDEGETDLEAGWKAFEEPEDLKTKAEAWNILVGNGTQSTSQAAHAMGLKPMFETEPFVITKDGPVFIKDAMDLREQTMQAKKAGLQMSIDNPGGMQNEQGTQQGQQGTQGQMAGKPGTSGGGKQGNASGAGKPQATGSTNASNNTTRSLEPVVPGQSSDAERAAGGIDGISLDTLVLTENYIVANSVVATGRETSQGAQGRAFTLSDLSPSHKTGVEEISDREEPAQGSDGSGRGIGGRDDGGGIRVSSSTALIDSTATTVDRENESTGDKNPSNEDTRDTSRAISAEFRRWRTRAIDDARHLREFRPFASSTIPSDIQLAIGRKLAASSRAIKDAQRRVEDVRRIFALERIKPSDAWEPPDVEDQLGILQRAEVATVTWQDAPGACSEICLENAGVTVRLGERFPGGQRVVVGHPHCQCVAIYRKADGQQISVSTGQEVEF